MDKTGYVKVLPDYSNTKLWQVLTRQMIRGHTHHIEKEINSLCRNTDYTRYFTELQEYAKKQKEFYETIEQISNTCLIEMKKGVI